MINIKKVFSIILLFVFITSNTIQSQTNKVAADKIIAIIGNNIIKNSEIESQFQQHLIENPSVGENFKCSLFEDLLFQKLLLAQAQIDSIYITNKQVDEELNRRLKYFISEFGSEKKLEEFYNKSLSDIKTEFRRAIKDQMLTQRIQSKITDDIKVSPTEVKHFYKNIHKDSLPKISSELEIAHIVKMPSINKEEKERAIGKLTELRERVLKGESFSTLALLYSEDPGSASKSGELGMFGRGEMFPEFEAASFKLKKGVVSDIVETQAGYHILELIERKGEFINVRHILIIPRVSESDLIESRKELKKIANIINNDSLSFVEAAKAYSDDPSKNSEGAILNPQTGSTKFQAELIDPKIFFTINKLKVGEISEPVVFMSPDGKQGYRILYLKTRTKPHMANLKEDYDKIQESALLFKKNNIIKEWITKKSNSIYIKVFDDYKDCQFEFNWVN